MMPMVMIVFGTISWQLPLSVHSDIEHESENKDILTKVFFYSGDNVHKTTVVDLDIRSQRFRAWFIYKFTWFELLYATLNMLLLSSVPDITQSSAINFFTGCQK